MKIYASAKIKDSQEVISLLRAFYAECNEEQSSYEIDCQDLTMEMDTKYLPAQTITAICKCEEFRISSKKLDFQKIIVMVPISEEEVDEEVSEEDTPLEQEEMWVGEEPTLQDDTNVQKATEEPELKEIRKEEQFGAKNNENARRLNSSIPQLKEILAKSDSIEQDVELVADFFGGLGKKKELFKRILEASLDIEPPVSWKKLNTALNMTIGTGEQNKFNKEVMSKLGMTILNFVKMLAEENYLKQEKNVTEKVVEIPEEKEIEKSHIISEESGVEQPEKEAVISGNIYVSAVEEQPAEVQTEIEISQEVQEETEKVEEKPRIKMECMPEIPWFEELLADIDKTSITVDKVTQVLDAMNIGKLEEKWKWHIIETVYASIKFSVYEISEAMSKAVVPSKDEAKVTMYMFQLINEFAGKYTETKERISVESFLKDIGKVFS